MIKQYSSKHSNKSQYNGMQGLFNNYWDCKVKNWFEVGGGKSGEQYGWAAFLHLPGHDWIFVPLKNTSYKHGYVILHFADHIKSFCSEYIKFNKKFNCTMLLNGSMYLDFQHYTYFYFNTNLHALKALRLVWN